MTTKPSTSGKPRKPRKKRAPKSPKAPAEAAAESGSGSGSESGSESVSEPVSASAPAPPPPRPPVLPSPSEAALEAARVVSEMVDIDSESGAVIVAAAAAGAALEAVVAAKAAAEPLADPTPELPAPSLPSLSPPSPPSAPSAPSDPSSPSAPSPPSAPSAPSAASESAPPPSLPDTADPITTVRLSRDRILRALDEDLASSAAATSGSGAAIPRARTEPGLDELELDEENDPVAIAAAAIARLRSRARNDIAELRGHYQRHDLVVLLIAFVIIVAAGRLHAHLVTPRGTTFTEHGLTFVHPAGWLRTDNLPPPTPRLIRAAPDDGGPAPAPASSPSSPSSPTAPTPATPAAAGPLHAELAAPSGGAHIEIYVGDKPAWSNIVTALVLERRTRWGELYHVDDSSVRSIARHDWLRTAYRYAHIRDDGDVPRVDRAVELATVDREQLYVITLYGNARELAEMEDLVAPSLRVQTQTGLPLVPMTRRVSEQAHPEGVTGAFKSTVMIVVADLVDGRLEAQGGAAGVIVGADGSILTNYHVLQDKTGRLHDVFIIGRSTRPDDAPQLICAGRPGRSKLERELDLALVKCDTDLDGRAWTPSRAGAWPALAEAHAGDVKMGQRLWVLGYPDVGGGGLTLSEGDVDGWSGEPIDGAPPADADGRDFIKTDASITHGNSGGPVVDDTGHLVGIATAFRTKLSSNGGLIETAQVGLVRPVQSADDLLAIAKAGWTPLDGKTAVELAPTQVAQPAAEGIRIYTKVIDDETDAPVHDATVMVLRAGVDANAIDMNKIDDQTIAWGKTNGDGEVRLRQLVPNPGRYSVLVLAPGYEPLIGSNALELQAKTPPSFDPWGTIGLHAR